MKKSLNKFIKGYMEVLYALSSVFYIGFCFCVLVQVISRNFLPNAPSWTEELAVIPSSTWWPSVLVWLL